MAIGKPIKRLIVFIKPLSIKIFPLDAIAPFPLATGAKDSLCQSAVVIKVQHLTLCLCGMINTMPSNN